MSYSFGACSFIKIKLMTIQPKRLFLIFIIVAGILLVPLIAMFITKEVSWSIFDFMLAGGILVSAGIVIDYVLRKTKNKNIRILLIILIMIFLFILWAELAVGIFNSPIAGS